MREKLIVRWDNVEAKAKFTDSQVAEDLIRVTIMPSCSCIVCGIDDIPPCQSVGPLEGRDFILDFTW